MSKVTVILPIKNAAHTLARAVQSIQGQASADWEMIAVDDGSSDGSVERMKEFIKGDHRIQLKINPTPGIANALNYGIAQANGKYIARMDADDFSHPDRLEKQSSYLDNFRHIGLVASRINFLGDREIHQGYAAYIDWTNELLDWNDIRANRFVESPFAHPSVMFRKSLVEPALGPYRSGDFPEDYELWLRWMSNGVEMAKLPDYLLDWYDPP
jgi:glycosyltransferase involved in cell wall biosynthesis